MEETFRIVKDSLSDEVVKATQAVYQFELSGEHCVWRLGLLWNGGEKTSLWCLDCQLYLELLNIDAQKQQIIIDLYFSI